MAEQEYVVIYAATYPDVAAAQAALDTIEHLGKEVAGTYDAAVVDKENGKAHVVKRMDHPHIRDERTHYPPDSEQRQPRRGIYAG